MFGNAKPWDISMKREHRSFEFKDKEMENVI